MPTITVTNTNDSGAGSLRQAILDATSGDEIVFAPGLSGSTITLTSGELDIDKSLTIDGDVDGDDAADITIDAGGDSRVFNVETTGTLNLNSANVTGGDALFGGGINVSAGGTLNVDASTFSNNTSGSGGAIGNDGTTTITNSTFNNNSVTDSGGAIFNSGDLTATNATFTGNQTTGGFSSAGGAIYSGSVGTAAANLTNVTITGNSVADPIFGGSGQGGGVAHAAGTLQLANTIIIGNTASSASEISSTGFTDNGGNVTNANPSLVFGSNVLADNGGPVQTIALLDYGFNPALDVGPRTGPAANGVSATDYVGVGNEGTNFGDAGAFELMCFAAGTQIATPSGHAAVEELQIGDLVRTAGGRDVPVKWIGRQTIVKAFRSERAQLVRIGAGALGNQSDLFVTGDHGMVLDGHVINASALVNGHSINWVSLANTPDRQTVYHIETEAHDIIFANGAASETYLDMPGRRAFDNFGEYLALYGAEKRIVENPMPRISTARLLPDAIRDQLGLLAETQDWDRPFSA